MRFLIATALMALFLPATGYCAKWEVPGNVTVRDATKMASYLETIDFSYTPLQPVAFAKIKLCIAENISNNSVTLQDSSNSFVGPATGKYYQNTQSQTIQGGGIFKYLDEESSVLIATGTADGGSISLGLIHYIVKFDLKAMTNTTDVTLKFSNITRAQQSTGNATNDGFNSVGMWRGAGAQQIYTSLELIAGKIKLCLN